MKRLLLILGLAGFGFAPGLGAQTYEPKVHAVIFYSPTCPHCHQLINEYLIPLEEELGGKLALLGLDTSQSWGNNLYWETIRHFELPEEDWVVPIMVVGDEVLIGGIRIPQRLDEIVEETLPEVGVDLPNIPAMVEFFREQNILDPRFPDRLVTRPTPGPGSDTRPEEEQETEATVDSLESAPGQTGEAGADTLATVEDTAGLEVPPGDTAEVVPVPEDSAVGGEVAAAEAADVPDPEIGGGETGVSVSPVDSAATEAEEVGPGGEPTVSEPPEVVVSEVEVTPTPVTPGAPLSDSAARAESGTVSGLGMSEAVQGMEAMTVMDRFNLDPMGNSISVLVLLLMVISLVLRGYPPRVKEGEWPPWVIPGLVVVGVGVAAYLSYIEVTHTEAVCGPVGDCNTVNQSEYATLFGVLPVGVLGLLGYGAILVLWFLRQAGSADVERRATLGLWAAALFGTVFSVYLTFLEPFVIGATCAWCLTSAVIMTLILWASSSMAARVWTDGAPSSFAP
jgi:uncharacterized membrane protein